MKTHLQALLTILTLLGPIHACFAAESKAPLNLRLDSRYDDDILPRAPSRIVKATWDETRQEYIVTVSSEKEMHALMRLKPADREIFENSRQIALAGLTAGGVLYLTPRKNIFFWESSKENEKALDSKSLLLNPMVGSFVSKLFTQMQEDLRENDGRAFGSEKLGSAMMYILNPTELLSHKINKYAGRRVLYSPETQVVSRSPEMKHINPAEDNRRYDYIGLRFQIKF